MKKRGAKLPPLPAMTKGLDVRRKLAFALFGGLLLQAIAPLSAARESKDDKITEEMILDF